MQHEDEIANEINALINSSNDAEIRQGVAMVEEAAKSGDAHSIYTMAKWYRLGFANYSVDDVKELELLKIAADNLVPDALFDLGAKADGRSESKSAKAFAYYVAAAVMGDIDSMDAVSECFKYGDGVRKDIKISKLIKRYIAKIQTPMN